MNKGTLQWIHDEANEIVRQQKNLDEMKERNRRTILEGIADPDTSEEDRCTLVSILSRIKGE